MAGPLELHGVGVGRTDKPVDGEVPGQSVRPFVAEHLDGLRLAHRIIEENGMLA